MKKILFGVAIVLGMVLASSCGCGQTQDVVEEEVVEAVDSLAVTDSLTVTETVAE